MPRTARCSSGGYTYHVLNRGNARGAVFHGADDYEAFLDLMAESSVRTPMRVLAYCLMPNHFHLTLWPREDGDVSRWMHWLMTTQVRRYLGRYRSSGHVWQGRFKAFPIQEDEHLLSVIRYIERNPLRGGLVGRAEEWPWSSLRWVSAPAQAPVRLEPGTAPFPIFHLRHEFRHDSTTRRVPLFLLDHEHAERRDERGRAVETESDLVDDACQPQ
jgi:putative transposase